MVLKQKKKRARLGKVVKNSNVGDPEAYDAAIVYRLDPDHNEKDDNDLPIATPIVMGRGFHVPEVGEMVYINENNPQEPRYYGIAVDPAKHSEFVLEHYPNVVAISTDAVDFAFDTKTGEFEFSNIAGVMFRSDASGRVFGQANDFDLKVKNKYKVTAKEIEMNASRSSKWNSKTIDVKTNSFDIDSYARGS